MDTKTRGGLQLLLLHEEVCQRVEVHGDLPVADLLLELPLRRKRLPKHIL